MNKLFRAFMLAIIAFLMGCSSTAPKPVRASRQRTTIAVVSTETAPVITPMVMVPAVITTDIWNEGSSYRWMYSICEIDGAAPAFFLLAIVKIQLDRINEQEQANQTPDEWRFDLIDALFTRIDDRIAMIGPEDSDQCLVPDLTYWRDNLNRRLYAIKWLLRRN